MTDETANLILEHLRHLRRSVDRLVHDVSDMKIRFGALEQHVAGLGTSDVRQNAEMDRINDRMDLIEKRLELKPAE
jgi:hypothetical protein